jgi:hypothetical protein
MAADPQTGLSLFELLFPRTSEELDAMAAALGVSPPRRARRAAPASARTETAPAGDGSAVTPRVIPFPTPAIRQTPAPQPAATVQTTPLTPTIAASLLMHPTPVSLAHAWLAIQSPGIADLLYVSVPTRVPAQGQATYTQDVPQGTVLVNAEPLRVLASGHDPTLSVTLVVDDFLIAEDYALTADTASQLPEWTFVERVITAAYTNGTWRDVWVTSRGKAVLMRQDVFWGTWMPLFEQVVAQWEQWAQAAVAAGIGTGAPPPSGATR